MVEKSPEKWTAEDVCLLRKLRLDQGLEFSEIASHPEMQQRRPGITREAVGGKLWRLGLCERKPVENKRNIDTDHYEVFDPEDAFEEKVARDEKYKSLSSQDSNRCFCGAIKVSRNYCEVHLSQYSHPNFVQRAKIEYLKRNKLASNTQKRLTSQ
jgi:hypothetical protein